MLPLLNNKYHQHRQTLKGRKSNKKEVKIYKEKDLNYENINY